MTGVELESGTSLQADVYILAAGVASPALAAGAGVNLPVYPLKVSTTRTRLVET